MYLCDTLDFCRDFFADAQQDKRNSYQRSYILMGRGRKEHLRHNTKQQGAELTPNMDYAKQLVDSEPKSVQTIA